jgi:uncharacterized protein YkwD
VLLFASAAFCRASEMTDEVLREINLARTSPRAYAQILAAESTPSPALREAVAFLQKAKPLAPVTVSEPMSAASRQHVFDQGARGTTGHRGSDGSSPWNRLARFGRWRGYAGEVICYGRQTARETVAALIVDDGVPDRGHRKNIFNSAFSVAGIAWGVHARYGTMCVVDFAGSFTGGGRELAAAGL